MAAGKTEGPQQHLVLALGQFLSYQLSAEAETGLAQEGDRVGRADLRLPRGLSVGDVSSWEPGEAGHRAGKELTGRGHKASRQPLA